MSTTVKQRYIHMTARKLRLMADAIRGQEAETALARLSVLPKIAAHPMHHAIKSALSAARKDQPTGSFIITTVYVDEGPAIKRRILRSRGRASRMEHRMSHITVSLEPVVTTAPRKKNSKKAGEE